MVDLSHACQSNVPINAHIVEGSSSGALEQSDNVANYCSSKACSVVLDPIWMRTYKLNGIRLPVNEEGRDYEQMKGKNCSWTWCEFVQKIVHWILLHNVARSRATNRLLFRIGTGNDWTLCAVFVPGTLLWFCCCCCLHYECWCWVKSINHLLSSVNRWSTYADHSQWLRTPSMRSNDRFEDVLLRSCLSSMDCCLWLVSCSLKLVVDVLWLFLFNVVCEHDVDLFVSLFLGLVLVCFFFSAYLAMSRNILTHCSSCCMAELRSILMNTVWIVFNLRLLVVLLFSCLHVAGLCFWMYFDGYPFLVVLVILHTPLWSLSTEPLKQLQLQTD